MLLRSQLTFAMHTVITHSIRPHSASSLQVLSLRRSPGRHLTSPPNAPRSKGPRRRGPRAPSLNRPALLRPTVQQRLHQQLRHHHVHDSRVSQRIIKPLTHTAVSCVAAYWTNTDPSKGGSVFYRQVTRSDQLSLIDAEVRTFFSGFDQFRDLWSFRSVWALVVTFDSVPRTTAAFKGRLHRPAIGISCSNTVTHQTIIVTDGVRSLTILNFNKLLFYESPCYAYAQVGVNAGDERPFYVIRESDTANISSEAALAESNVVGLPGKWVFVTDGDDASPLTQANPRTTKRSITQKPPKFTLLWKIATPAGKTTSRQVTKPYVTLYSHAMRLTCTVNLCFFNVLSFVVRLSRLCAY